VYKAPKIKNGSRDVTTTFSGTVCSPCARTSYNRPVYRIWNLYVDPLQRYEKWRKLQKWALWRLWVTQGHKQHSHSI